MPGLELDAFSSPDLPSSLLLFTFPPPPLSAETSGRHTVGHGQEF